MRFMADYLIADNRLTENGSWDEALLRELGIGVEALGGMPPLADGEHSPFQQMTFILLTEQAAIIAEALQLASQQLGPPTDAGENKNQNGNALAEICRAPT